MQLGIVFVVASRPGYFLNTCFATMLLLFLPAHFPYLAIVASLRTLTGNRGKSLPCRCLHLLVFSSRFPLFIFRYIPYPL